MMLTCRMTVNKMFHLWHSKNPIVQLCESFPSHPSQNPMLVNVPWYFGFDLLQNTITQVFSSNFLGEHVRVPNKSKKFFATLCQSFFILKITIFGQKLQFFHLWPAAKSNCASNWKFFPPTILEVMFRHTMNEKFPATLCLSFFIWKIVNFGHFFA